jgi:ketosteroid isomerase-like protein
MRQALVVLFLPIGLCAIARAADPPSNDVDVRAVMKVLQEQEAAWNKGDLKGFMKGYWNSPELSFYSGRDKRKGWQETYDRFKQRYQDQGREMGKLTFSELLADRLSDTKMLVRGRWKLVMTNDSLDGLFSLIVEKKSEGWRIVHDHTSVGEPMPKDAKKQP